MEQYTFFKLMNFELQLANFPLSSLPTYDLTTF